MGFSEGTDQKFMYYQDEETKEIAATLYVKTESGKWIESGDIPVDRLIWQYAHDNKLIC